MKTMFVDNDDIQNYFLLNLSILKETIITRSTLLSENSGILSTNNYQTILKLLKPTTRTELVLNSVLINELLKAENLVAEGCFYTLLGFISDKTYEQVSKELERWIEPVTNKTIKTIIKQECQEHKKLVKVLEQVITLAGLEYQIVISPETTKTNKFFIELKNGYWFDSLKPLPFFDGWESKEPLKVLLVDGSVERVSELENIFTKCSQTKQPLVIFAQGFSEEVLATILANNKQERFFIYPLKLEPSLEGLNVLNDVAAVCGGDVVSSLKGQQIIWTDYSELPVIDGIMINKLTKQVCITNQKTEHNVIQTVNELIQKRDNHQLADIKNLLDKRVKTLLSKTVVLKFPETDTLTLKQYQSITETVLRKVKTVLMNHYGVVKPGYLKSIKKIVPVVSLKLGWLFGEKLKKLLIDQTGGAIVLENV